MLTDNTIDELLSACGITADLEAMLESVMTNMRRCPLCSELFPCSEDLPGHIADRHEDDLPAARRRHIDEYEVKVGTEEIFICKFCGYAVGMEGYESAFSRIWNHVEACPKYLKVARHEHKSWRWSADNELIRAYASGHAEIELYKCPYCDATFGTRENLVNHIIYEASVLYSALGLFDCS